jgi:uncharacterized protein
MYPPAIFRLQGAYLRLEGQVCEECGSVQFPVRSSCRNCGSISVSVRPLSGRGTVRSFTELSTVPGGFTKPCVIAIVALEEGVTISAVLTDVSIDRLEIGMPVEMVTRRIRELGPGGCIVYAYKFRPPLA